VRESSIFTDEAVLVLAHVVVPAVDRLWAQVHAFLHAAVTVRLATCPLGEVHLIANFVAGTTAQPDKRGRPRRKFAPTADPEMWSVIAGGFGAVAGVVGICNHSDT